MTQDLHDHDGGLDRDLPLLLQRRSALKLFAGAGLLALAGCSSDDAGDSASTSTGGSTSSSTGGSTRSAASSSAATTAATTSAPMTTAVASTATPASAVTDATSQIPEETAGPFPGDGSNGKNVLTQSGVVRSDIRPSLDGGSVADGVPFTMKLQIVKVGTGAPLPGTAVYVWQCDREGNYSMYSQAVANETYLRGVQEADANGSVTFTSIFPGCYPGRWPHVHYEVYPSLSSATSSANKIATSQLALVEDVCRAAYAADGYADSLTALGEVSLASDGVFSDGAEQETPSMDGSVSAGFTATLVVPIKA